MTGVTVTTTRGDGDIPVGLTVSSLTSVSLDPPLLLVCISEASRLLDCFRRCRYFGVSVLSEDQKEVSDKFSRSCLEERFEGISWESGETGVPLLQGSVAWFECERYRTLEAGDHEIVIGRVEAGGSRDGEGLGYYKSGYVSRPKPLP
jgi:flavin reductase (DIM6/NTAB) family NADH-FMN oxidoreductase RutF